MSHAWRLAQLHGDLGYDLSVLLGGALGDVARGANLAVAVSCIFIKCPGVPLQAPLFSISRSYALLLVW